MPTPADPDRADPDRAGPTAPGSEKQLAGHEPREPATEYTTGGLTGPAAGTTTGSAPAPSSALSAPRQGANVPPGMRRPRPVFLLIGVALAAALAAALVAIGAFHAPSSRPGAVGTKVPSFSLPRVGASGKVDVPGDGGGDGRPAILLFFASWCTDCHKELPALSRTYRGQELRRSRLSQVRLLGVDVMDPTGDALSFMRKSGVTFPVGADVIGHVMDTEFEQSALPTSVFVEANGTIAGIHYGALSTKTFVSWEHKLLTST